MFDFDGTLSPTVSRPELAMLPARTRLALTELASAPGCRVGVVSGRSLDDLRDRVDIPGVWLAGSAGLELSLGGGRVVAGAAAAGMETIAEYARCLLPVVAGLAGVSLEHKPLGLTIHHRDAEPDTVMAVRTIAADLQARAVDLRVTVCALGVEIAPCPEVHKGTAVGAFVAAAGDGSPWLVYAGNDANDAEAMIEVARRDGLVISVGEAAPPAHEHVSDPNQLCDVLEAVALAIGRVAR